MALVYNISRETLNKNLDNWGKLMAFPHITLVKKVFEILEGKICGHKIPMRRLGVIAQIGIDRHQFHDHFQKTDADAPDALPVVYGGGEEVRGKLVIEPNAKMLPKTGRGHEIFNEYSSILLIPDRIWIDTTHVIAILATEKVLSNIFYAVKFRGKYDDRYYKALALWLNTTWGLLTVLANRQETRGRWISLKMSHWRLLPVLDVTSLDEETVEKLAEVFDKYSGKPLKRLPEQYNVKSIDPVRKALDKEFLKILGIEVDDEELLNLYRSIDEAFKTWIG